MSAPDDDGPDLCVAMSVPPEWKNVDLLRTATRHCVTAVLGDGDASTNASTIVSELLENAIKYGAWTDRSRSQLRLELVSAGGQVRIAVANPTLPDSPHLQELMKTIAWIRSYPSPCDAYAERVRELADGTAARLGKMGLVRIACEAPCTLDARIEPNDVVVTTVVMTLGAPRPTNAP